MIAEKSLWAGDMPTQLVAKPDTYEKWEFTEPLPFQPANGRRTTCRRWAGVVSRSAGVRADEGIRSAA
jgi:hypothetical protein